jgi:hypothetical protein
MEVAPNQYSQLTGSQQVNSSEVEQVTFWVELVTFRHLLNRSLHQSPIHQLTRSQQVNKPGKAGEQR